MSDAETQTRIGLAEEEDQAYCSSKVVPKQLLKLWEPRKTQISTMELLAAVMSIIQLKSHLTGKRVVLYVDAEAVEGQLVEGHGALVTPSRRSMLRST